MQLPTAVAENEEDENGESQPKPKQQAEKKHAERHSNAPWT